MKKSILKNNILIILGSILVGVALALICTFTLVHFNSGSGGSILPSKV